MEQYDILICGAGSAGFCAAVAAARMGMKTALVEKYHTPGGILTVLGSNSIDQFNNPYIAQLKMVIAGKEPLASALKLLFEEDGFFEKVEIYYPTAEKPMSGYGLYQVAMANK